MVSRICSVSAISRMLTLNGLNYPKPALVFYLGKFRVKNLNAPTVDLIPLLEHPPAWMDVSAGGEHWQHPPPAPLSSVPAVFPSQDRQSLFAPSGTALQWGTCTPTAEQVLWGKSSCGKELAAQRLRWWMQSGWALQEIHSHSITGAHSDTEWNRKRERERE